MTNSIFSVDVVVVGSFLKQPVKAVAVRASIKKRARCFFIFVFYFFKDYTCFNPSRKYFFDIAYQ